MAQRTVMRWESGESPLPHRAELALSERLRANPEQGRFRFIDLFAGIGGTRLGWESVGGRCVFTSEWNKYATKTYLENFGEQEGHTFAGDITAVPAEEVPDHDVLLGGFPCQPFSIAGVSKKNALGRPHGFADQTQGTLFFDVARIIDAKRPRAFMLENVRNLVSHDKGRTFEVIMRTLREELGYHVQARVLDASPLVPQGRQAHLHRRVRRGHRVRLRSAGVPADPADDERCAAPAGRQRGPRDPVHRGPEGPGGRQVHADRPPVDLPAELRSQAPLGRQRLRLRPGRAR